MESSGFGRNARAIARFIEILSLNDTGRLGEVLTDDHIQVMPQSGEVVRGIENMRAILDNYPRQDENSLLTEPLEIIADEPRYVMSPTFNLVKVEGSGDHPIAILKSHYPDGSRWWVVVMITMRGDKIARSVTYFAPEFPPPEWRSSWVELSTGEAFKERV
jgi:hypothetical protein